MLVSGRVGDGGGGVDMMAMHHDEHKAAPASVPVAAKILCCMCAVLIDSNPSNTCATCLASTVDVTRGISTEVTLHQCRGCQRWHKEGGKWIGCELESRELMALCLSNVSGLKQRSNSSDPTRKVRLVDAMWIWTEPHSMRLKIKLTIQREVQTGTILQQSFVVTFIVRNQQCIECQAEFRQGSWKSLVQVRQRVAHKRTFLFLEQLILKHGAHRGCLSIETFKDGMDFYFPDKSKAAQFITFLENNVPVKVKTSKKLIGTDDKSNIANYKYTNLVEICPLCKDDLVYLPKKLARNMGNISRCVLVKNISNLIHFVDPLTGQTATMTPEVFWRQPFRPIVTAGRSRLTRYIVLGREAVILEQASLSAQKQNRRNASHRRATTKQRNRLALVTVAKERDLGINDEQNIQTSCIGYLLRSGDVVVGYDLKDLQLVDDEAEEARDRGDLPDVILCRKLYGAAVLPLENTDDGVSSMQQSNTGATKKQRRMWTLERLDVDVAEAVQQRKSRKQKKKTDDNDEDMDEEDFMQEVEADKEMRQKMHLYKAKDSVMEDDKKMKEGEGIKNSNQMDKDEDEDEDDDDQQIRLDELLDGLALNEGPDNTEMNDGNGNTQQGNKWNAEELQFLEEGERAQQDGLKFVGREEARTIREKDAASVVDTTNNSSTSSTTDGFGVDFAKKHNFHFK